MSAQQPNAPFAARAPVLHEGDVLDGRYAIGTCLGGGGMASVYRATHIGLARPVAVKVVSPLVSDVPGMAARFSREAHAATRLRGEHVVRVFDVGTTPDGAPYMVMELLEGSDLGQLLDGGLKPTLEQAVDFVLQACEALAEVHGLGIVHLDLKPGNLFVTRGPDGLPCVKLIDFGISRFDAPRAPARPDAVEAPEEIAGWSAPEVVMGSPRYMPPEQMESAASTDPRSDIWGLGAIFYEMLVGHAPFDGESLFDIYAAAVRAPPPRPSKLRPGLPGAVDGIALRCLRVDPAERYADVAELANALAPFGGVSARARARSIARVLDASRARCHDGTLTTRRRSERAPRARTRAWLARARAWREPRVRTMMLGGAAIALFAVGIAARPIVERLGLTPRVDVTNAAATVDAEDPDEATAETTITAAEIPASSTTGARSSAPPTRGRGATLMTPRWAPRTLAPARLSTPEPEDPP